MCKDTIIRRRRAVERAWGGTIAHCLALVAVVMGVAVAQDGLSEEAGRYLLTLGKVG